MAEMIIRKPTGAAVRINCAFIPFGIFILSSSEMGTRIRRCVSPERINISPGSFADCQRIVTFRQESAGIHLIQTVLQKIASRPNMPLIDITAMNGETERWCRNYWQAYELTAV